MAPLGFRGRPPDLDVMGVAVWKTVLSTAEQRALRDDLREVVHAAPLVRHETRRGQKLSVRMTAAGALGWVSDRRGYRYAPRHPEGQSWPAIPARALEVWRTVAPDARAPDSCLVNFYGEGARMGLHQDRDEADLSQPVVSISLGDAGLFRVGGPARGDPTTSLWLQSGDVACLAGSVRLAFHGIDRIRFGSSTLLPGGGRLNVTLRVAGPT